MSAIDDLLQKVGDPVLRGRLEAEIKKLKNNKKVGLVFEDHIPECTPLYDLPVKKGSRVAPRDKEIKDTYMVLSVDGDTAHCVSTVGKVPCDFKVDDIMVVAEFGEPIYPCLQEVDRICNAPENDTWHTLIQADNYHALQLLKYMYAGKVDCIYIDPPYNTGAKDWKYNNSFVDSNDSYPHSKWLSFMKRRLALAKELLNPEDSVLIVTIDEKEYLRLGMLLEDMFKGARIQMISSMINPSTGSSRAFTFGRTDEYIYFVFFGNCIPQKLPLDSDWIEGFNSTVKDSLHWAMLSRQDSSGIRKNSPGCFYPIFVNNEGTKIVSIGESLSLNESINSVAVPDGCRAIFPIRSDGTEGRWQCTPNNARKLLSKGYMKLGKFTTYSMAISFLRSGEQKKIENGEFTVIGYNPDGSVIIDNSKYKMKFVPGTQWRVRSHDAGKQGSRILNFLIPDRKFPYPKSLYAVEDCIRFFVANKPNALILDFFAGSGTTAHATMLLNHLDGGHRRCISVTNNEVGAQEEKVFKKRGLRPGDPEWEEYGIARYVTWPRIKAAITGINTIGEPIKGSYKFTEEFPMSDGFAENSVFFKLGFLDKNAVALGRQFKELLSVLWMKAGAVGPCPRLGEDEDIPDMMVLPENRMAILINDSAFAEFEKALQDCPEIDTAYIVTDSAGGYREMIRSLDVKDTYQLYRDYLDNFRINDRK